MRVNYIELDKFELASTMAEAEKFVGTQGGGMDQAASLLSQHNKALKIDFNPLSITAYPLSAHHCFVVTHTKAMSEKSLNTMWEFNRRSVESRLAGAIIGRHFHEKFPEYILNLIGDLVSLTGSFSIDEMYEMSKKYLDKKYYTLKEIQELIPQEKIDSILKQKNGSFFQEPKEGFALGLRLEHVFSEWIRVIKSTQAMQLNDMKGLGQLINKSHFSCRDNHQVSCVEADVLSDIARDSGLVLGSRITGAGFGGCVLNLVENEKVSDFVSVVKEKYYKEYLKISDEKEIEKSIFIVKASDGAGYLL